MIMSTGKGINDMGDPDACTDNPDLDYGLFSLVGASMMIGICVPKV